MNTTNNTGRRNCAIVSYSLLNQFIDSHSDKGCQYFWRCLKCPYPVCVVHDADVRTRKLILGGEIWNG